GFCGVPGASRAIATAVFGSPLEGIGELSPPIAPV
ncbi:unnamed protein product, partial [marine sediment metagenome]